MVFFRGMHFTSMMIMIMIMITIIIIIINISSLKDWIPLLWLVQNHCKKLLKIVAWFFCFSRTIHKLLEKENKLLLLLHQKFHIIEQWLVLRKQVNLLRVRSYKHQEIKQKGKKKCLSYFRFTVNSTAFDQTEKFVVS